MTFVFYGSTLLEVDTLLVRFQKLHFLHQSFNFLVNVVRCITGNYQPTLLISNNKYWTTTKHIVLKFEEKKTKIETVKVLQCKYAKFEIQKP